ncbi:hypothetical protein Glaag_3258 [Glaciecola sp. 4H-3-7+YE-5]|nr:hypothetical protein Glaag_3258 [Glaciecola sp. 4H-3-7+YE-5]
MWETFILPLFYFFSLEQRRGVYVFHTLVRIRLYEANFKLNKDITKVCKDK